MTRDLDHLNRLLGDATPAPDPDTKAAHLKLAQENFAALCAGQAEKDGWLTRLRRMRISALGGVATVAACIGALFLVLPQNGTRPATLSAPEMVIAESDTIQELAAAPMADAAPAARMSEAPSTVTTEAFGGLAARNDAGPVGVATTIRYDFASPSALLFAAPWAADALVLIIVSDENGGAAFDPAGSEVRTRVGDASLQGTRIQVLEIARAGNALGKVSFGDRNSVTLSVADVQPPQGDALLATALAGFDALRTGVQLDDWTAADAIALAAQNIGADPTGERAALLDRMRQSVDLQ